MATEQPTPDVAPHPVMPVLHGRRIVVRPMTSEETFTMAAAIANDPEANPWWGEDAAKIEHWLTDQESVVLGIEHEGRLIGIIQFEEENDPDYRLAGIDLSLLAPWVGRGLGSEALYVMARHLIDDRGHHRIHIDPAASNARAIAAYAKVGFRPVGIMRRYERGPDGTWRDGLLMDLLAEELIDPAEQ